MARHITSIPDRLLAYPVVDCRLPGIEIRRASTFTARLVGLAGLSAPVPAGHGLLLPRTRSVHTFGMRFTLDLVWLDGTGRTLRVDTHVPPRRVRACARARAVVELAGGAGLRAGARAGMAVL